MTYDYDKVGNRERRIIEETDANGERAVKVTNYTYDERDRLVQERSTGATLYLAAADGDPRQLAALQRPPRQRVFEHALSGLFGLATLGLVLGFMWPRSTRGRLGKSARRRQLFTSAVAIFLVPLMGVDLSTLADLNVHAWQRAALADTTPVDEVVEYEYDDDGNLYQKRVGTSATPAVLAEEWLYDAENRLTLYEPSPCEGDGCPQDPSAQAVYYEYDHDGIRIAERTGTGHWKYYLVDKQRPYAQVLGEVVETPGTQARYH